MSESRIRSLDPGVPGPSRPAGASYDAVPYESHAISNTDPDSMATMATLFGMHPAGVATCRVLELGCAGAGNLTAMALPLPGARFFGIDASARQIEEGRALTREMGVENVELLAADLQDLPPDLPEFDYIVCHGVYSWVAPAVQTKILEVFARHLAPQGVAFLSYNTYPGGHLRLMAREMMRYHVRKLTDPEESTTQARALFQMVKKLAPLRPGPYEKILEYLGGHLENEPDWYVFHEYLEEHNEPVYFSELAERAARHGLAYLAPANFLPWEHRLPPEAGDIPRIADRVVREQYLDFLCNRMFRRTLFCRSGSAIADEPRPEAIAGLLAVGRARPAEPDLDVRSEREGVFRSRTDEEFRTNRPLLKATLAVLAGEMPRAIPVAELAPMVVSRLEGLPEAEAGTREVSRGLLVLLLSHAVELRTSPGAFVPSVAERPVASPLARRQAARGGPAVNLRHRTLDLTDIDAAVLPLLDGSRDRARIREEILAAVREDRLSIQNSAGERLVDPDLMREVVGEAVEDSLDRLARNCFLTA